MKTEWQTIKDYPNYQVSNTGKIRRIWSVGYAPIKTRISKVGYESVSVRANGKSTTKLVHRVIAEAFIKNPENKPVVNHKNGIKHDNRIVNLEWNTVGENNSHFQNVLGKKKMLIGKFGRFANRHRAIQQIGKDKKAIKKWYSMSECKRELSGELFLDSGSLTRACQSNGKKFYKGFFWKYEN